MRLTRILGAVTFATCALGPAFSPVRAASTLPAAWNVALSLGQSVMVPSGRAMEITQRTGDCDIAVFQGPGKPYVTLSAQSDIRGFVLRSGTEIKVSRERGSCLISYVMYVAPVPADQAQPGTF